MTAIERKTEFWWASIAGADPEPVERCEIDGRPAVYTCGCADPFYLDEKDCPVRFLMWDHVNHYGRYGAWKFTTEKRVSEKPYLGLERPKHPDKVAAETAARDHDSRRLQTTSHGWRGPR